MQMRVRLLEAQGRDAELLQLAAKHSLWAIRNPYRVNNAILNAIYRQEFEPLERVGAFQTAFDLFRTKWSSRLEVALSVAAVDRELAPLHAYAGLHAGWPSGGIARVQPYLTKDFINFAELIDPGFKLVPRDATVPNSALSSVSSPETPSSTRGAFSWNTLLDHVTSGRVQEARGLLETFGTEALLADIQFVSLGPDKLFALATDPRIEQDAAARLLFQEVLSTLIDALLDCSTFPEQRHRDLYLALADCLTYLHGGSASEEHSNLLVGLVGAALCVDPRRLGGVSN